MTLVGLIVQWVLMMQTSSKLFSESDQPTWSQRGLVSEISGPPHIDIHNEDRWSESEETPSAM